MSTHIPGFQSFSSFSASFCIGKYSHSSIRGKDVTSMYGLGYRIALSRTEGRGGRHNRMSLWSVVGCRQRREISADCFMAHTKPGSECCSLTGVAQCI